MILNKNKYKIKGIDEILIFQYRHDIEENMSEPSSDTIQFFCKKYRHTYREIEVLSFCRIVLTDFVRKRVYIELKT